VDTDVRDAERAAAEPNRDRRRCLRFFDGRIKALRAKYPNYDSYLNQFSDEFGVKLNPSTIMVWEHTPPIYKRVDALGSFRAVNGSCFSGNVFRH
jgi:hypothetical protein